MSYDSTFIIPVLVDTVVNLNDSNTCKCYHQCESVGSVQNEYNFFSTDLFANLVSAGALLITLVIFIIQTRQARKEQRRTIKENWFLTIVLQPNMEELDEFYKAEAAQLETQIKRLRGRHGRKQRKRQNQ